MNTENNLTKNQGLAVAIAALILLIFMGVAIVMVMAGDVTGQGPAYGAALSHVASITPAL